MNSRFQQILLLLTQLAINALALVVAAAIFAKIWFDNPEAMVAAAILLALVNTYLRPLIMIMMLPLTVITLGLFTVVINAGLLKLVSWAIQGFHVEGFWTAIGAALVISLISFFLNLFLRPPRMQVSMSRR